MAQVNLKLLVLVLFASPFVLPSGSATTKNMDEHLEGRWTFDEVKDGLVIDFSRHGRHATPALEWDLYSHLTNGIRGKALNFPGNAFLVVKGYKGIIGTAARTIVAWIKGTEPQGAIIRWGENEYGRLWSFGYIRRRIGVTPFGGYLYMKAPTHDGHWHLVAITLEQANPPNLQEHATLYLDGKKAEIDDIGLLDLWPIDTGSQLDVEIGRGFKGLIDELRIYSRVLTPEEIEALWLEERQTGQQQ